MSKGGTEGAEEGNVYCVVTMSPVLFKADHIVRCILVGQRKSALGTQKGVLPAVGCWEGLPVKMLSEDQSGRRAGRSKAGTGSSEANACGAPTTSIKAGWFPFLETSWVCLLLSISKHHPLCLEHAVTISPVSCLLSQLLQGSLHRAVSAIFPKASLMKLPSGEPFRGLQGPAWSP